MKFKVNDKVRIIDSGESFTTYPRANEWLREIGDTKPYHYGKIPKNGLVGVVKGMYKSTLHNAFILAIEIGDYSYLILESGVELIEDKTEFTYAEVILRNIPGIYVNCNFPFAKLKKVEIQQSGIIVLYGTFSDDLRIRNDYKFRPQESKKKVKIYKVEHTKNGKKYDFVKRNPFDNSIVYLGTLVQCDTKYGISYGKCVGIEDMELTEAEIKEYKECWRAE